MMPNVHELNDKNQNQSWNDVENSGIVDIISKYNLANVITGLYKSDLIRYFKKDEPIHGRDFNGMDLYLISNLLIYLETQGILIKDSHEKAFYLTKKGVAILSDQSIAQLCFYTEAYGNITSNIDKLLAGTSKYGRDLMRDGKALGVHCDTLFKEYHTPTILEAIQNLNCKKILDIGCGGGQFLIDICSKYSSLYGIGLDISAPAISYANDSAQKNNLANRIEFFVADAFDLSTWKEECFSADILSGSGVLHEHFRDGEESVINILNKYAELLISYGFKAIILGEPEIRYDLVKNDADLYLVHIFTAQGFPRYREQWIELFKKTKLKCENIYTRPMAGPRFNFFILTLK